MKPLLEIVILLLFFACTQQQQLEEKIPEVIRKNFVETKYKWAKWVLYEMNYYNPSDSCNSNLGTTIAGDTLDLTTCELILNSFKIRLDSAIVMDFGYIKNYNEVFPLARKYYHGVVFEKDGTIWLTYSGRLGRPYADLKLYVPDINIKFMNFIKKNKKLVNNWLLSEYHIRNQNKGKDYTKPEN